MADITRTITEVVDLGDGLTLNIEGTLEWDLTANDRMADSMDVIYSTRAQQIDTGSIAPEDIKWITVKNAGPNPVDIYLYQISGGTTDVKLADQLPVGATASFPPAGVDATHGLGARTLSGETATIHYIVTGPGAAPA